jgi:Fe-S-cluster containining protein
MKLYVVTDPEGDYIFKTTPCVFLDSDNYCRIYDVRPKACREYPHTDINKVSIKLLEKNIAVCPAVFEMVNRLKQ